MSNTKTKFDYEIEEFELAFKDKRHFKIAIYGIGRMTATLLEHLKGFHIVGLLDRDMEMIGKELYGVKILSREETEKNADIIIINTSQTYWNTIYQRIHDWKIPIYFRNGDLAAELSKCENTDVPYYKISYADLRKMIQQYEVISFDIFDTLIMRRVYLPIDIFLIVERRLKKEYGIKVPFVEVRKKVAGILDNGSINEIYYEIQKLENWDNEFTETVKKLELQTERQFLTQRKDMVKLYNEIKKEKEVFFISDMYLPCKILGDMLKQCGIEISEDHIIVSCDYRKLKRDGTLWKYYKNNLVLGRKAFHIGDDEKADGELPKRYGIDSYIIWSADKMIQNSSIRNIISCINTLYASISIGLLCTKIFNSPFALHMTDGKITFYDERNAGYCLLGSIMHIFCDWILRQAKENDIKQYVFFAREGYLLTRIFNDYCQLNGETDIPQIIYMEISRRAVLTASIKDRKDIYRIAEFPYMGSVKNFLQDRFGLSVQRENRFENDEITIDCNKNELRNILKKYENEILTEADRERHNYLKYIESLDLDFDFAVIDSQLYGTTQYYLGKLLERKLKGYYFCVCLDKTNKYLEKNWMKGCFPGKRGLDGKSSNVYKNAAFIEAFFTAPYGMLECIEDDGSKRYAENKKNQVNFDVRLDMLMGIQEYMKDIMTFCKICDINITYEDIYFTDKLFGIFMDNGFNPTEKMKESFFYDNGIVSQKEVPIWE